eukprot:SM000297S10928  [mRNA]  locus=s297:38542:42483:+ [translate_table: standard]
MQPLLEGGGRGDVVVEVCKESTADLLRALAGAASVRLTAVEDLGPKLFVQCARQAGMADVYFHLLDQHKEMFHLKAYPALAGLPYGRARHGFPQATVCGLIRDGAANFHPDDSELLRDNDKLLMVALAGSPCEVPQELLAAANVEQRQSQAEALEPGVLQANRAAEHITSNWATARTERLLLLGWRPDVVDMILEYDAYVGPGSELTVLAEAPAAGREAFLRRRITAPLKNLSVIHKEGVPMSRTDLRDAICKSRVGPPASAGHAAEAQMPLSIVVVHDKSFLGKGAKPDKQSLYALLLAESVCRESKIKVESLVAELVDASLGRQVARAHPSITFVATSKLMGLVTAQELNLVWKELLNPSGNEIYVKDIDQYLKPGEAATFEQLAERATLRQEVAIGYHASGETVLNPMPKSTPLRLQDTDSLIVISEFEA